MTYGVPYSFVPGTKAKADEVNANFIDVLNKIEDVDEKVENVAVNIDDVTSRFDSTYTDIESSISTINTTLAAKANSADIDGTWHKKSAVLSSATAINTYNIDLSSYLPKDNNVYEILIGYLAYSKSETYTKIYVSSSLCGKMVLISCGIYSRDNGNNFTMPIAADRVLTLYIEANALMSGYSITGLKAYAYRKVR